MARSQFRSQKKVSGKKFVAFRKKRLSELAGLPALTVAGKTRLKIKRVAGGNTKRQLLSAENVMVTSKGKTVKLAIKGVETNPANINFTRRSIITKGTIVTTEKGNVKITSRPGQSGTLFGIFTE